MKRSIEWSLSKKGEDSWVPSIHLFISNCPIPTGGSQEVVLELSYLTPSKVCSSWVWGGKMQKMAALTVLCIKCFWSASFSLSAVCAVRRTVTWVLVLGINCSGKAVILNSYCSLPRVLETVRSRLQPEALIINIMRTTTSDGNIHELILSHCP